MKYTGINRIFQSENLQKILDIISKGAFAEFLDDWKWIFSYTAKRKKSVALYTAAGLLSSTLGVMNAYIAGMLINIISQRQMSKALLYIGLTVGIAALSILADAVKNRISKKAELDIVTDIQNDLLQNIADLQWSELGRFKNGDLLNRFNSDMITVMDNAISWIPDVVINLFTFAVTVVLLFGIDPVMGWIGLCTAPFMLGLSKFILRRQKDYFRKMRENESDMVSFEAESFYNMDTIKSLGVRDYLYEKFAQMQKDYRQIQTDYNKFNIKTSAAISLINTAVTLAALGYCLLCLWTGNILIGDMTFFLSQRNSISSAFNSLVKTLPQMLNASVSAHRIREFIALPKEKHDALSCSRFEKACAEGLSVEADNLSFSYSDGSSVYESMSFEARPGEIVGVVGESGAGKTTLFRLLLGLVLPEKGSIVIKDAGGNEIGINADIRKFISYVPQGNTMMAGTVADNMRMVKKDASDEEIIRALKTACAWEFVEPVGIDGKLGERGKGISEGQAQRLGIARAVLRDAPILFLDEATSALDEETESRVIDNIVNASPGKTVIISTHRPALLKRCKRVYRIEDRRMSKCGESE